VYQPPIELYSTAELLRRSSALINCIGAVRFLFRKAAAETDQELNALVDAK
jgi:hypothetical protein